jgi:hypothetical protein
MSNLEIFTTEMKDFRMQIADITDRIEWLNFEHLTRSHRCNGECPIDAGIASLEREVAAVKTEMAAYLAEWNAAAPETWFS